MIYTSILQLLYNNSRKFKIKQLFFKIIFKIVTKIIIVKKLKYDERIVICCFKIHKSQLNVNIFPPVQVPLMLLKKPTGMSVFLWCWWWDLLRGKQRRKVNGIKRR